MTGKMLEILQGFKDLEEIERNTVILRLLRDRDLLYEELSKLYVASLEYDKKAYEKTIAGLAVPLSSYWLDDKPAPRVKSRIFIKARSAYHLLKSRVFHTAQIEKDFEKYLERNPYEEDRDGMPI